VPAAAPAQPAEVLVDSNVPDATVLMADSTVGRTNAEGEILIDSLPPGRYALTVRKPGYWSAATRVDLKAGLTTTAVLNLMSRPTEGGNLLVETNVADATASIDGQVVGRTGPDGQVYASGLSPGTHRLAVRKEGYAPITRTLTFEEPGLDRTVRLRLTPADSVAREGPEPVITAGSGLPDSLRTPPADSAARPTTGRLVVEAGVAGARVFLDDSARGRTDRDGRLALEAPPGPHRVELRKEGYRSLQTTARLGAGGTRTLSLELTPAPTTASTTDRLGGTNLLLLFFGALVGLAVLVGGFLVITGWQEGTFVRWFRAREQFDRYDILDVLRRSEFATVYRANDPEEHGPVALQVLDDPYTDDPERVRSFLEKGRTLHQLHTAAPDAPLLNVYRVGREHDADDGRPFVAFEHLSGETLLSLLKDTGPLDGTNALTAIRQVCRALKVAHAHDIFHGAVTPENIIVVQRSPEFRVKLVGLGLRGQNESAQMPTDGTAAYVAPEQLRDGQGDWRADMYAVGMLFYKLVTGAPPYADDDPTRVLERTEQTSRPDLPDSIPEYVKPVFYRMISADPDRRPTAARVVSVLELFEAAG
jgi:hypothetical protein